MNPQAIVLPHRDFSFDNSGIVVSWSRSVPGGHATTNPPFVIEWKQQQNGGLN